MFHPKTPAFNSVNLTKYPWWISLFIAILIMITAPGYASQTQTNSVLYVREQTRDMPDDESGVIPQKYLQFLILKDDQTAYGNIPLETPIHTLTLNDLTASHRGIWVAQQASGTTYIKVRWEEGGDWKLKSLELGSLRDDDGDFQMALPANPTSLPGTYQADTNGQVGAQSAISAAVEALQQYHFGADGRFQQFGCADQIAPDASAANLGGTTPSVKVGSWQLRNYDLALTYSDGATRNLKIYQLADGLYFNKVRFKKIQ